MSLFNHIEFVTTVAQVRDLPPATGAEVAFVGRSNAGKSSAINTLTNTKRLAYVSKSPGKTRHINFFRLGKDRFLVDLPGYGYARAPASMRAHWDELVGGYLQTRSSLQGLALIMDIRQPMTALDQQMIDWFLPSGKPIHILLNKADKLNRNEALIVLRQVNSVIEHRVPACSAQIFSSRTKIGLEQAQRTILAWLKRNSLNTRDNKKPPVKGE